MSESYAGVDSPLSNAGVDSPVMLLCKSYAGVDSQVLLLFKSYVGVDSLVMLLSKSYAGVDSPCFAWLSVTRVFVPGVASWVKIHEVVHSLVLLSVLQL